MGVNHNLYPASAYPSMVEGFLGRRQLTQFTSSLQEGRHIRQTLCRAAHITHYTRVGRTASQRGLGAGGNFSTLQNIGRRLLPGTPRMCTQGQPKLLGDWNPLTKAQSKRRTQSEAERKNMRASCLRCLGSLALPL